MTDWDKRTIQLPDREADQFLRKHTRRSFLVASAAAIAGIGGYAWLRSRPQDYLVPWPQRKMLGLNEKLAHAYLSDGHLAPEYGREHIEELRVNGDYGVSDDLDAAGWRLHVDPGLVPPVTLTLADVTSLPRVTQITRLYCIEGWSTVVEWTGARFADFTRRYFPAGSAVPDYVYMETPGSEYYVGLDARSAMHPQTLLAYERNGQQLEEEHGAPLRLVMPVKYGIKNIKRIGTIRYTNKRPRDYWYEQGYDWFAGL
jgi:DMSO/TMAO reductase YedYZ molybdopterin-dependent catalytic subunit